jgi:hypothetical protein
VLTKKWRLLTAFEAIFAGKIYRHRSNNQGDQIAVELYEDLFSLGNSRKFQADIDEVRRGISLANVRVGIGARRGDGTLGEFIPGEAVLAVPGYAVRRGPVATLDIGVEVKILNKAMVKQINERITSLKKQAEYFVTGRDGRARGNPITIAIVGVNHADYTVGYEGERLYRTDGKTHAHPFQEAQTVEERIRNEVVPKFDETIMLRYKATNEDPYPFEWVDASRAAREYAASLVRISSEYERRF